MKKAAALLLSTVFLIGALAGCGESGQQQGQEQSQEQSQQQGQEQSQQQSQQNEQAAETMENGQAAETMENEEQQEIMENEEQQSYAEYAPTGTVSFMNCSMKDLELKDVELADYIKDNEVTMLNIWGTFCGPCINEMPDLGELERKYKDQGFEIVGLTCDVADQNGGYDEDVIADALDIIDRTEITYPVLACSWQFLSDLGIQAVPTTYFVDSEGNILGQPILGSNSADDWDNVISGYLNQN